MSQNNLFPLHVEASFELKTNLIFNRSPIKVTDAISAFFLPFSVVIMAFWGVTFFEIQQIRFFRSNELENNCCVFETRSCDPKLWEIFWSFWPIVSTVLACFGCLGRLQQMRIPSAEGMQRQTLKRNILSGFFLRKMLGTRYGPAGTRFL